jgi:hypothetical protein
MKNIGKLFLVTAILMIFTIQAQSQTSKSSANQSDPKKTVTSASGTFVDKDNNGVCDNFESKASNRRGPNFVDKNNDGICDNRANVGRKSGNTCRYGQGNQHRHGQGRCCGYGNCCRH